MLTIFKIALNFSLLWILIHIYSICTQGFFQIICYLFGLKKVGDNSGYLIMQTVSSHTVLSGVLRIQYVNS